MDILPRKIMKLYLVEDLVGIGSCYGLNSRDLGGTKRPSRKYISPGSYKERTKQNCLWPHNIANMMHEKLF